MAKADNSEPDSVCVKFSAAEKRILIRRSRDTGQTVAEYIRDRVLTEACCEEQIFRYLVDELTRVGEDNRRAVDEWEERTEVRVEDLREEAEARRERIVKEVRESLTQREIAVLARFFKPAFDAGLWPESSSVSHRKMP